MAADACQAHAETYMGLVEIGAGLVPAGGGCLRMVERWTDDASQVEGVSTLPFIGAASLNIAMAKVSTGAHEAQRLRYLRSTDGISLNREHLLYNAKYRAIGLARSGYRPPLPKRIKAAGMDVAHTIGMRVWSMVEGGFATPHDAFISKKIAHPLRRELRRRRRGRRAGTSSISKRETFSLCAARRRAARAWRASSRTTSPFGTDSELRYASWHFHSM